jgi:hypothetical protein
MTRDELSDDVAMLRLERPAKDRRDERLWALLPAKDAPYDYDKLSKAEMDALVEALGDGFGDVLVQGLTPLPLPSNLKSGLLEHFFYRRHCRDRDEEGWDEGWDDAFWSSANGDDEPPPYESFPLGFHRRRLRVYFQNQFERFCEQIAREDPAWASLDRSQDRSSFEELACDRLYEKPWYELHALWFLDWIERPEYRPALAPLITASFAGQLGRLVEQYYWRFRFEAITITGAGARKGASAGGRAKASSHQPKHSAWQHAASQIWKGRPELGKLAVAQIVRKKHGIPLTAKHIARYIKRP